MPYPSSDCVPALLYLGPLTLYFPSKAGVEIFLGLQLSSPGDLSPDHIKPIQFTHMPRYCISCVSVEELSGDAADCFT